MANKMRMTAHNGRAGKHGAYSAKHNDRNFDPRQSDHINEEKSSENWYWHCYQQHDPTMTFEDVEAYYYESHFREALDERNQRSIDARHPERVKTMDDYRSSQKTCPEEQIVQIGRKDMSVDSELLKQIAIEQINWEQRQYPNFRLLDVALHVDEEGAPHIHKRGVWVAHDDDGRLIVGQAKALAEMGIDAPDQSKKYGKYNNAKMTHTAECREHLAQICREHGLDLELTPREHSKSGLALEEYKAQQEQERARQAEQAREQAERALQQAQAQIQAMSSQMAQIELERQLVEEKTKEAQKALKEAQRALKQIPDKEQELDAINAQIETAQKELKKTLDMKARASEIHHIFGDKETQSYHANMLKSTRAIGSEAYEHMKSASSKLQEVAEREQTVKRKEQEIDPLHRAASKDRAQAKEYLEEQERYILRTAEKKAQDKFDSFVRQEFGQKLKGRDARLEQFADSLTLKDGRTVLDAFNEQEQELQQRLNREWDYER